MKVFAVAAALVCAAAAVDAAGFRAAATLGRGQRPMDAAVDVNDPYFVDDTAPPAPSARGMRFRETMGFGARGTLICRGKQCPLSADSNGDPLCCPQTDHCCPANYKCDETDANNVKCIPQTGSTGSSDSGSSGEEDTSITVSEASEEASSDDGTAGGDESSDDGAAAGNDAPAAGGSTTAADGSGSAPAPSASSSDEPDVPKFRQNIIIVKNINVLTKMNQNADSGSSSEESAESSAEESSEESS